MNADITKDINVEKLVAVVAAKTWMYFKALEILDSLFMEQTEISVDDWFRDSPNIFQGRKVFAERLMKAMSEETFMDKLD